MSELWSISKDWDGEICTILGGGATMSLEIARTVRDRCRVIAVNNQGIGFVNASGRKHQAIAPWADILYAADRTWWYNNKQEAEHFIGMKVTVMPNGFHDFSSVVEDTKILGNGGPVGFDDRPTHIRTGFNSGYQAMHVAAHLGVRRILLCGFDMHAQKGEHWFGDHKWRPGYKSRYKLFMEAFDSVAPEYAKRGIEVLNCTPDSALKCFPNVPLEEGLTNAVQRVWTSPKSFTGTCAPGSGRN